MKGKITTTPTTTPTSNVPTEYKLPTLYSFKDIVGQTFKTHGHCNNFLHLMAAKIWPEEDFISQDHYSKGKGPIKVTT